MTHYFGPFLISSLVSLEDVSAINKSCHFQRVSTRSPDHFIYKPQTCTTKECHNTQHITRVSTNGLKQKTHLFLSGPNEKNGKNSSVWWKSSHFISKLYEYVRILGFHFPNLQVKKKQILSRELTYPTLGKGKSSSKCHFWGNVSSQEGTPNIFVWSS